jgi:hypothetical protein
VDLPEIAAGDGPVEHPSPTWEQQLRHARLLLDLDRLDPDERLRRRPDRYLRLHDDPAGRLARKSKARFLL